MPAPDSGEALLDRRGEEEWQRLRRHLELAEGFWLGFLFTPSPRTAAIFRNRTERWLRSRVRSLWSFRPETPEELRTLLPSLFMPHLAEEGCVWIEAVRADPPAASATTPGPWTLAWDELLLRLNERRERLRRHLGGGLVLAAPPFVKVRAREAAPDLWSIRSLVLEPPPTPAGRSSASRPEIAPEEGWPSKARSGDRSREPVSITPTEDPVSQAAALLREVEGLLALNQPGKAIERASAAVELLRGADLTEGPLDLAVALAALAEAEAADGDFGSAAEHLETAVRLREENPIREVLLWLDLLGKVATRSGELARVLRAREQSLAIAQRLCEEYGDSPQALRDLSVSLNKLGDARREAGDLGGATAAYEQSLEIAQRLREEYGDSPQALRDLSAALDKIGDVRRQKGDLAGAAAAYEEALALDRRLVELYGETPKLLEYLRTGEEKIASLAPPQPSE
jgi:tetratricopeptide (TPR) repeat protein